MVWRGGYKKTFAGGWGLIFNRNWKYFQKETNWQGKGDEKIEEGEWICDHQRNYEQIPMYIYLDSSDRPPTLLN